MVGFDWRALVENSTIHLGKVIQEPPDMRRRRGCGGHVRARGVVTILISSVLHLHQLALGGEEAVAAGHQHARGVVITRLLARAAVIIGETKIR